MGTRGTGIRPLLWRFKQAILGGFVGCFVTVIGGNQVGAAIGDASAQYEFVSRPSMAIESVCVADPAIQIDVGLLAILPCLAQSRNVAVSLAFRRSLVSPRLLLSHPMLPCPVANPVANEGRR